MQKINAILPMRAGSQRVKNKNIRLIAGKPLYEYILKSTLSSKLIEKVIINTDIKEVLERYKDEDKVVLVKREEHLRGNCNMNCVIKDTLSKVNGQFFVQVHATNPLLSTDTIDRAIRTFFEKSKENDCLFSVTRIQKRIWRANATPLNHNPNVAPTTQDLEPLFEENSCLYIFSRKSFSQNMNRIGRKPYLFESCPLESFDIDTEDELRIVERMMK